MAEYFVKRDYYPQPEGRKSLREIGDEAAHLYQSYVDNYERAEYEKTRTQHLANDIARLGLSRDSLAQELTSARFPRLHVRKRRELEETVEDIKHMQQAADNSLVVNLRAQALKEIEQKTAAHYAEYAAEYHEIALLDAHADGVEIVVSEPLTIGTTEAENVEVFTSPLPNTGTRARNYLG